MLIVKPDIINSLHREAIKGVYSCAGQYRTWGVRLRSSHKPPESRYVPGLVEEMCSSANGNTEWDPIRNPRGIGVLSRVAISRRVYNGEGGIRTPETGFPV